MPRSPIIQSRIAQNRWTKKQELARAMQVGYLKGANAAAKVAKKLLAGGWTNAEDFNKEIIARLKRDARR